MAVSALRQGQGVDEVSGWKSPVVPKRPVVKSRLAEKWKPCLFCYKPIPSRGADVCEGGSGCSKWESAQRRRRAQGW